MKKQFLNLGIALNKAEQKEISGGSRGNLFICEITCPSYCHCVDDYNDYCVYSFGPNEGQYCVDL